MKPLYHRSVFVLLTLAVSVSTAACVTHRTAASVPAAPLSATPRDENIVIARINETNITRLALIEMMNRISTANANKKISEPEAATRKRAMDLLIVQELAYQEAKRTGLTLRAGILDKAMEKLRMEAGSAEEYGKFLEKEHLTDADLRARVERNLLIQQAFFTETVAKIVIPEDERKKEYERTKDQFTDPEKITITDITFFLGLDDPASIERANAVLARILEDKDKDPANLRSDGTFLVQNYELEKKREPLLYDAARKLKVGELSGVIRTRDSIHIIKLTDYVPEKPKAYQEVSTAIENRLRAVALKTRRAEWELQLKQNARIEILDGQEKAQ